ncbi:MAG: GNAT family N-acetyltransferase [Gammaproteobacteria bacterium]|nr:GNAT family N-acetyltransferase [Gammaproteobacteria bacterium]
MEIFDLQQCPDVLTQLAQWHHDEWGDYNPGLTLEQRIQRMRPHLEDVAVPSTYVAKDHDVLGSADIVHHDMTIHQELTPWLASVYVEQSHRRQGIGSELVKHVMQQAVVAGYSKLYLFTPDQVSFYRRLGWQQFSKVSYCGHDVIIMTVDLQSS